MDRVVAATQFRDQVLVFTERGDIYRIRYDDITMQISISLIHQFDFARR